jgi:phosphohistidine phosphatase
VTRRLHLLRHAKSSWDDDSLPDHARPLSPRGTTAAERMRRRLEDGDVRPGLVLCSTALRARDTLERVLSSLGAPRLLLEDGLYHTRAETLLERVRAVPDDVCEVMLVGHNPGLENLIELLAVPGPLTSEVAEKFPTGALATLESEAGTWSELEPRSMSFTGLVLPRLLG